MTGFRDWIAELTEPAELRELPTDLDPIERDALDSSVGFAAEHARRYIATSGLDDGWRGPKPILLLYTTGRRSTAIRRTPVLYFDHDDRRFIIGSKGGNARHPSWYLNLLAEPRVHVRVMADFYPATALPLDSSQRREIWTALVHDYPVFARYQERAGREIPIVQLQPRR